MRQMFCLAAVGWAVAAGATLPAQCIEADLLVAGGSEAAVAAAVQASRLGVGRVVLVNDIDRFGGQFSNEGVGPADVDDLFTADIAMTNGTAYISWSPDRPDLRATRVYKLKGATSLTGPWAETDAVNPPAEFRQTNSFFKVTVELAP